ncbi:MAG: glycosyltransferase family 2 protein [Ignavibacteriae bacterium]|nr:glycosyltransferase family 2 protein [Ignavibacteriota bacterium]
MQRKNNNLTSEEKKKNTSSDDKKTPSNGRQGKRRQPTFRRRRSGHYNVNKKRDVQKPDEKTSDTNEESRVNYGKLVPSNQMISVVIPLYNEEESLMELSLKLYHVLDRLQCNYEVIFVDDGSTDDSFKKIKEINSKNARFHCIRFRRNYGKSAALAAGFKEAKGDIVITMDADLQDDPDEIPELIQKLNEGYDLVTGWKKVRYDPFIKKHTSKLFNFVTSKVSGVKLHDFNCGLKAYKKDVVKSVKIYGEMHRYVPALAHLSGFKVTEKPVKHHARKYGVTKFGPSRFLNGFLDLMTVAFTMKFMSRPLHLFGILGFLSFICGFIIMAYLTFMKYVEGMSISDRPLFLVGILFTIVGVQFLSLGLIAEMITKTASREEDYLIESKL